MRGTVILTLLMFLLAPSGLVAQETRPSLVNNFQLGAADGGVFCRVQSSGVDPALENVFDRAWSIICPDAADAVGRIYALRASPDAAALRLNRLRPQPIVCEAGEGAATDLPGLGSAHRHECSLAQADVAYTIYSLGRGKVTYVAEGLAGYESALRLALRSIVADRIVPGDLDIAITGAGDPAAFARVQAGSQAPGDALEEAYRRNNAGSYAEAAEFFETLLERADAISDGDQFTAEILINHALQKSNLGLWREADLLFARADAIPTGDPVQLRLRRNFRALHFLNQGEFDNARTLLNTPIRMGSDHVAQGLKITPEIAATINSSDPMLRRLNGDPAALTLEERSRILDNQARILLAVVDRVEGRSAAATEATRTALADLDKIRGGLVASVARLRAQGLSELALIAEGEGDHAAAEDLLRRAVDILAFEYPGSVAVASVNARLAAFLIRRERTEEALAIYRALVAQGSDQLLSNNMSDEMLAPYFAVLAREMPDRPELAHDFFLAGEALVRPGVAKTQAVLARQFSGGADEASRLFRQAVALTRDVERTRIELARVRAAEQTEGAVREAETLETALRNYRGAQVATQAQLAQVPRYRAIGSRALTLEELQAALRAGEAYYKLIEVGPALYAAFTTTDRVRIWRLPLSAEDLEKSVQLIRETIVIEEGGQYLTLPFDVKTSLALYESLFGFIAEDLSTVRHLIFEPDGAMLRLPPNLLIEDPAGAETYLRRIEDPEADAFDMRGIGWFGRDRDISTATSSRSFKDLRGIAPSDARHEYLGLGANAPVGQVLPPSVVRSGMIGEDCAWGPATWNQPISPDELVVAKSAMQPSGERGGVLLTGAAFTDTALLQRDDLDQYRIMHFATHGLVTPPQPGCSVSPALVTSFGQEGSDGLLSFAEIFELDLDADLIILSACDTAGRAGIGATEEAGLTSGGQSELDGLVRAFVGAGGRLVVASHWPVPDDYDATKRLISGLFASPPGTSTATALRHAQSGLMNDAATSHPYYWSGFAVIGDGSTPVIPQQVQRLTLAD